MICRWQSAMPAALILQGPRDSLGALGIKEVDLGRIQKEIRLRARPERGVAADARDNLLARSCGEHQQRLRAERLDRLDAKPHGRAFSARRSGRLLIKILWPDTEGDSAAGIGSERGDGVAPNWEGAATRLQQITHALAFEPCRHQIHGGIAEEAGDEG